MREKLSAVLDKSLKANGVQLTHKELNPVVNDLMSFLEPKKQAEMPEPAPVAAVELKPIPVKS